MTRRARTALLAGCMVALLAILALAGCDTSGGETPTPTVERTLLPTVAASATVAPFLPTDDSLSGVVIGASNPTLAGLAAEGEPSVPAPTITPLPTQQEIDMAIFAEDGLALQASYYSAPARPAPAVLLLHMEGEDRRVWDGLVARLQASGLVVLTVDLRGHGATGGAVDWTRGVADVRAVLAQLGQFAAVDPTRIVIVGASISANIALNVCAESAACAGTVLLSPGLDYRGITTTGAMALLGTRPALILASENDGNNPADSLTLDGLARGDHQVVIYPETRHGTALLDEALNPPPLDLIASWIVTRFPPPAAP